MNKELLDKELLLVGGIPLDTLEEVMRAFGGGAAPTGSASLS